MALAAAYKKDYGKKSQRHKARFDKDSGKVEFFLVKKVVDESMLLEEGEEPAKVGEEPGGEVKNEEEQKKVKFNPERHIMLKEAKKIKKNVKPGDNLEFPLPSLKKFGRIAAQTAKQVLLQQIKEAEREAILGEFKQKEEEIISGIIQRKEGDTIFVDIGKTLGALLKEDQIPGEFYKLGNRMRFYLLKVREGSRGPEIYLSRSHPKFLSKLFELEVPEIASGSVEIRAVVREPGSRSKIAVSSKEEGVDPVGSCVGARGTRVNAVMQELGREKIDIITFSEKPEEFIENALSPAKVVKVKIQGNKAKVEIPKEQLSLAIGRDGQNVKLASELTGWKIDVVEAKEKKEEKREEKEKNKEVGEKK
jgi:N utilization substance protein A